MERIIIKTGRTNFHCVELKELEYIHASKGRTIVKYASKELNTAMPFIEFLSMLEGKVFRCHRSYAINLDKVQEFTHDSIRLTDKVIPLGSSYKKEFFALMFKKNPLLGLKK